LKESAVDEIDGSRRDKVAVGPCAQEQSFQIFQLRGHRNVPRISNALFSCKKFCKIFQHFSSNRIFRRMHDALNIDKNKTNYIV
jgi:hypothetical protein